MLLVFARKQFSLHILLVLESVIDNLEKNMEQKIFV